MRQILFIETVSGMKLIGEKGNSLEGLRNPCIVMMQATPGANTVNIALTPYGEPLFNVEGITLQSSAILTIVELDPSNSRQKKLIDLYIKQITGLEMPSSGLIV